jgi:hypothetical protein
MQGDRIPRFARDERRARLVGFSWGLAEGLFFFIVPDVYITFAALFSLRAGAVAWLASIAGSAVAASAVYVLSEILDLDYLSFLLRVPGISAALLERVAGQLVTGGLPYTPWLGFGGVPLKVYVELAFSLGLSLGSVLLWTVFARIVRIAPVYAGAAAIRLLFGRRIDSNPAAWTAALALIWFLSYVLYFIQMSGT